MSKELVVERIKELEKSLNHFNATLENQDAAEFAMWDVKIATKNEEVIKLIDELDKKLGEYAETLANFEEIENTVAEIYKRATA